MKNMQQVWNTVIDARAGSSNSQATADREVEAQSGGGDSDVSEDSEPVRRRST